MTVNLNIPQHWDDLSTKQLQNICSQLHYNYVLIENKHDHDTINKVTYLAIAKELLRHNSYASIKVALRELRPKAFLPYVDFIFNQPCNRLQFPEVNQTLATPSARLKDISIGELSYTDALFYRFNQSKTIAYLNRLCAALYRPPHTPFSKQFAEANTPFFEPLPLDLKLAIAKAFEGSRNYISLQFPTVFPKPKTQHQTTNTKTKPVYVPFGHLIAVKIDFDPSKLEHVEQMNAYKFLALYETELRELKKKPKK